jgi:hypothetical protein
MQMPDVNVLVYAHREESPDHERYAKWLASLATGPEPFAARSPGTRPHCSGNRALYRSSRAQYVRNGQERCRERLTCVHNS